MSSGRFILWFVGAVAMAAGCGRKTERADDDTPPVRVTEVAPVIDAGVGMTTITTELDSGVDPPKDPFGVARVSTKAACSALGNDIAEKDVKTSFVDGDDLLAIVNRSPTGQLAPDWAPSDMVDIRTGKPATASECEKFHCLRKDAATALGELLERMKLEGHPGKVESAFRSYGFQCGTFANWAKKSSFCEATEQSALPGHSQHQLGTTVDLFSEAWAKDERGVFREGFGCTDAGRFLREHATDFGFVMPYPIHPDDRHPKQSCVARWDIPVNINPRTGYRYEHWHLRYVGREAAERFEALHAAKGNGTPRELTVEQWLRMEKGLGGADAELPVCDGCNCGACSTLAERGASKCDKKGGALHLDEHGRPLAVDSAPVVQAATMKRLRKWPGRVVEVKLDVPAGVLTQPPITGLDAAGYEADATFERLAPYPKTGPRPYAPLPNAWVVAVEPVPNETGVEWPYRAAIAATSVGQIYNRANVVLPAKSGAPIVRVLVPGTVTKVKVAVLQGGSPRGSETEASAEATPSTH